MVDSTRWKLFRCIYDYDGRGPIEGEGDKDHNEFEDCIENNNYGNVGWVIGILIEINPGWFCVKVMLEGEKEVLEHILKLVKRVDREDEEAELNQSRRLGCLFDSV